MSFSDEAAGRRAAELRASFDRGFAEPSVGVEETLALLAFRTGGTECCVRLAEVGGLFADRNILRLPTTVPDFMGVSALRRDLVPVYGLGALLGYGAAGETPRWLILARAAHVAFAFDAFEGHLQVPPSSVLHSPEDASAKHVSATVRLADGMRGIVSIASLLETIEDRMRPTLVGKEQ